MTEDTREGNSGPQKPAQPDINFDLLRRLRDKPHPHINDAAPPPELDPFGGWGELSAQAKVSHHLLDMVKIPNNRGYTGDLDARTWLLLTNFLRIDGYISRLRDWHSRETFEHGMVGDNCTECGNHWPCDTRRLLDGEEIG